MTERAGDNIPGEDIYDQAIGEIPSVPIGQLAHVDSNGSSRYSQVADIKSAAEHVGAEVTDKPHGEHDSTVITHKAWVWVGGALAAAMGLTAAGIATTNFAIEHHKRKHRK